MNRIPPKYSCAILVVLFSVSTLFAQLSTKHYIPPLTAAEFGNANPNDQYLYLSTPSDLPVSYAITPVGQPSTSVITGVVTKNSPVEIFLGNGYGQLFQPSNESSTVITDRGYIIESRDVIYVSVRMRGGSNGGNPPQAGALVSKGLAALGTSFRSGHYTNDNPQTNYCNFFSLMATENNTNVVIDDLPAGISIKNYAGTFPINITLNEGESYVVATNANESVINQDGLIGTSIESDKPIVVNSGSANGSFWNGNGRDYGIDQIAGANSIGNEYIFVRGDGIDEFENVLIVAHEDNTDIFINGGAVVATINAGEYYLIEGDQYNANGNMFVETSNNVFAYQGVGGNGASEPNQGMFFVPPLSCNNRGDLNSVANINNIGPTSYVGGITIVTNKGSTVDINNQPIANFAPMGPYDVDGNPDYVTYKVLNLNGNVSVISSGELYCSYFNYNGVATSGSFYSGFPGPPDINFDLDVTAAGNCIPNITLEALNVDVFDVVEWHYDDGTGFIPMGVFTNKLKPLNPGGYKIVGTITCSGLTFDSPSVRVSICPDDFDNDGIIDNLDIDIDNDGILNCDESLGNVNLDLTDFKQVSLDFADGTSDDTFAQGALVSTNSSGFTNSFVHLPTGDFITNINAAFNAELSYNIEFQDDVNVKFQASTGYIHTPVDGEQFAIIIGPREQNITLIDPDDTILIDTDFDGVFEAGVTSFSTSEIRFIYNPTPNGNTPFSFVASKVNEVTFRQTLTNNLIASSFRGNLSLTCFKRDSDGDGQEDSFDIDSDNDGIIDLIEANGSAISLLNIDSDSDGLDNVFNNIPLTPVDTDTDGILDYLDLDSDNDGIYDLVEANHGQLDFDLDGIIDNANSLVGVNGFVDLLETVADSFIANYTPNDSDNDNIYNFTELDSDDDFCFDVLEANFTDNDDDGWLGDSPITVDNWGRVTSGVDGYTDPGTDYLISAPIILNTPFEDVAFCEASNSTITVDAFANTYQWEYSSDGITWNNLSNDVNYSGTNAQTLLISNLPLTFDGLQYRVFMTRPGNACNFTTNPITLSVSPLPIVDTTNQFTTCDDDTDGLTIFNLEDSRPILSSNYLNETFIFYPTFSDAQGDMNPIVNPSSYNNANGGTVYARVISNFGCYVITEIELVPAITNLPASFTRTYEACDDFLDINGNDSASNDDRDGITTFDFSAVTGEILNELGVNPTDVDIKYFRNQTDALNNTDNIEDPGNYRNIGYPNAQTIYVSVVSNIDNSCIYIEPTVNLIVNSIPESNTVPSLVECDSDADGNAYDGITQTFNLESQRLGILGTQNPNNFTVTYHNSSEDARDGINAISNTTDYENQTAYNETIYVRVVNNTTGCVNPYNTFNLLVNEIPDAESVSNLIYCDDDSDGSAFSGYVQNIDLESQTPTILGSQDPTEYSVTYHATLTDAEQGLTPLASPFSNTNPFNQTIYIRVQNLITGCVNPFESFDIIVNPAPRVNVVANQEYCDDDSDGDNTNGIVQNIDLESLIPSILGNSQSSSDYTVTFHTSQLYADTGELPISSPYTNMIANQQTIYTRVQNNTTGCYNTTMNFDVIINSIPVLNTPNDLELCDDDYDGIVNGFNVFNQTNSILDGLNSNDYNISYHTNQEDASSGDNPITTSDFTNTIPNQQTIYVRGVNNITSCISDVIQFNLVVNTLPQSNTAPNLEVCDTDFDGILSNIDLSIQTPILLGNQNPNNFSVTYHETIEDAENNANAITDLYTNTSPFRQVIYVKIENTNTNCGIALKSFDLVINPIPEANQINNLEICDDDSDGDNTNGILQNIDLESLIPSILGNSQSSSDYTVTFHTSQLYADTGELPISSPYTNMIANQQTIYTRVQNNTTGCYNTTMNFDVIINSIPVLNTPNDLELCDDDYDGIVNGFNVFNQTNSILDGLNSNDYNISYHTNQEDASSGDNPITTSDFTNTIPNQQTIYVRGVNNITSCISDVIQFNLVVNTLPQSNTAPNLEVCDTDFDGILSNIDLSIQTPILLGNQNPNNFSVTYHETIEDAENNANAITDLYTNTSRLDKLFM